MALLTSGIAKSLLMLLCGPHVPRDWQPGGNSTAASILFIDLYNGSGSFARWPSSRRDAFLAVQQARGDLWEVLFDDSLQTLHALAGVTAPVHVVEGSATSAVDHAICGVVRRYVPHAQHSWIEGAGHMMPRTHPEPLTRALLTEIER